jgi:hypothetical protein
MWEKSMFVWQSRGAGAMTGTPRAGATGIGLLDATGLAEAPMFCRASRTAPEGIDATVSRNHWGVCVTIAALTTVAVPILIVRVAPAISPSM